VVVYLALPFGFLDSFRFAQHVCVTSVVRLANDWTQLSWIFQESHLDSIEEWQQRFVDPLQLWVEDLGHGLVQLSEHRCTHDVDLVNDEDVDVLVECLQLSDLLGTYINMPIQSFLYCAYNSFSTPLPLCAGLCHLHLGIAQGAFFDRLFRGLPYCCVVDDTPALRVTSPLVFIIWLFIIIAPSALKFLNTGYLPTKAA